MDNFDTLAALSWQVHVYGTTNASLASWCAKHKVPLHQFEWKLNYKAAGLIRNALYLLRPDTYVALADTSSAIDTLEHYFAKRNIQPVPSAQ